MAPVIPVDDKELARWIRSFNEKCGYSPNVREICEAFGWRSSSTGHAALNRLIQKGYVTVGSPSRRQLVVGEHL